MKLGLLRSIIAGFGIWLSPGCGKKQFDPTHWPTRGGVYNNVLKLACILGLMTPPIARLITTCQQMALKPLL